MAESRKLAAILAADVVGYSRLAGADEDRTLARLRTLRSDLVDPTISVHRGRVVKRTGDGILIEFRSVVDAVRCAVEVQNGMVERNAGLPPERRIEFRVGIHVGDVVEESDGDLMGDGVNIAARLEGIAAPGAICLSEDAYRQVKARLGIQVSDLGPTQLKNIADPMRVYALQVGLADQAKPATPVEAKSEEKLTAQPALAHKPSIAVLPFQNMSGDAEQEHFCDGLVEDIITTLSKLSGLRVIARHSSFVFKGGAVDVREAAKQLGVRYVLEGSVRKGGSRIRITTQLIDAMDGAHIWAERYDRAFDDVFAIQDEITLTVATEMQVKLIEGEQARMRYTTTSNVEAWTYWVRGLAPFRHSLTRENYEFAKKCWERALLLDPGSAPLNAMLGFIHLLDARFGWWDDRETALVKAGAYADRALQLDPLNADAHIVSGGVAWLRLCFDEAEGEARRAVELAPGSADVVELAAFFLSMIGNPTEAITSCERAMALNPNHPPMLLGTYGYALRLAGRLDEAISAFKAYDARVPGVGFGLVDLVIIYQQTDRPQLAREAADRLLKARPQFTIDGWRMTQIVRDPSRLEREAAALRAAGLPS